MTKPLGYIPGSRVHLTNPLRARYTLCDLPPYASTTTALDALTCDTCRRRLALMRHRVAAASQWLASLTDAEVSRPPARRHRATRQDGMRL
jgi:hypothetical protein